MLGQDYEFSDSFGGELGAWRGWPGWCESSYLQRDAQHHIVAVLHKYVAGTLLGRTDRQYGEMTSKQGMGRVDHLDLSPFLWGWVLEGGI